MWPGPSTIAIRTAAPGTPTNSSMNGAVSKAQVYRCLKPRTSTQKANEFSREETVKPVWSMRLILNPAGLQQSLTV